MLSRIMAVSVLGGMAVGVAGQTPQQCETGQIFAPDGESFDVFGQSVSVDGDVAVVGVSMDNTPAGNSAGSAVVYRYNGTDWLEEAHLFASDGAANDRFGTVVAISDSPGNEIVIVGAYFDDTSAGFNAGSAYIFQFSGTNWVEVAHLFALDGLSGDLFGGSVSVRGNVVIVGAWSDDTTEANAGSVYVFRFGGDGWIEESHLFASDGTAHDRFGGAVSVSGPPSGEFVIVGAAGDDTPAGADAGSVYLFKFNGTNWEETDHLFAVAGEADDRFGSAVSASGDHGSNVAIVGAGWDDIAAELNAGSAFIYRFNGANWVEEAHLFASNGEATDRFGGSVSIRGDAGNEIAIVGAISGGNSSAGSAYVYHFKESNWVEEAIYFASDGTLGDNFGGSVSLSGEVAFVGAQRDTNAGGTFAGSVYFFNLDCNGNGNLDFDDIASGVSSDLNHNGVPDECETTICVADIAPPCGDGVVDIVDLTSLLNAYGPCPLPHSGCRADITPEGGKGIVNIFDLVALINAYGPCP